MMAARKAWKCQSLQKCPTVGQSLQIFAPQNVGDTERAMSDLCYKITPHSDILAKVLWDGVLRPWRLEREKNKSQE